MPSTAFLLAAFLGSLVPAVEALLHGLHAGGKAARLNERRITAGVHVNALFPFYHTGEALKAEVRELAAGCNGYLTVRTEQATNSTLAMDVVRVRRPTDKRLTRVFILAGEHAREMIGPETVLYLLKALCGRAPLDGPQTAAQVLEESEFEVILNANPEGRRQAEHGHFCLRQNPQGVDLNRNWDTHWEHGEVNRDFEQLSGSQPFSEPEAQLARNVMEAFRPDLYLSVHSGTLGMYMPWAYSTMLHAGPNQLAMMDVLEQVDAKHCQCPYGHAGHEVGYACPGTSVDYAYDKLGTPFSFAYEIWTDTGINDLQSRYFSTKQGRQQSTSQQFIERAPKGRQHVSALQVHAGPAAGQVRIKLSNGKEEVLEQASAALKCFRAFNPDDAGAYSSAVKNWAEAYLDTAHLVSERLEERPARRPPVPTA